jgi:uncharacterized protein YneR
MRPKNYPTTAVFAVFSLIYLPIEQIHQFFLEPSLKRSRKGVFSRLTILFVLLSVQSFSQRSTVNHESELWRNEPFGARPMQKELVDRRDANSKHFQNDNGGITAHIASGPINYFEDGQWKTIYHTISPTSNGFENVHNNHKTFYPSTSNGSITTILENGAVLKDMVGMKMYYEVNGQAIQVQNIQSKLGNASYNELTYSGVYGDGIDLRLTQNTTQRKMDYIIHNPQALGTIPTGSQFLVFEEQVELPRGWIAELKDNVIYLKDATGKVQAAYERPEFMDAPLSSNEINNFKIQGEGNSQRETNESSGLKHKTGDYQLIQDGNILTIKTKVEVSWLLATERNFPLTIDPTINVVPNNAANWTRSVAADGWDYAASIYGHDGVQLVRSSIKFNLSTIPICSTINSASAYYNQFDGSGGTVGFTFIWRNSNDPVSGGGTGLYNSMSVDYSASNSVPAAWGWFGTSFNATGIGAVQSNIGGTLSCGICPTGAWISNRYNIFYGFNAGVNRPYILVDYTLVNLSAPQALGNVTMGANFGGGALLPDANITATTCWNGDGSGNCSSGAGHEGWRGRVFNAGTTGALAWAAQNNVIGTDYLQIDLGTIKPINAIATQSRGITRTAGANDCCNDQRVTSYEVRVSNDGISYTSVGTYAGNTLLNQNVVINNLPMGITGRFVRLYPTAISGHMSLRAEVISIACNAGAQTVNLSAEIVPGANTVRWWTAATGGTLIGTGQNLQVSISASTTYYAEAFNTVTGCVSATRTAATATISIPSVAPTAITGVNAICYGGSTTLTLSGGSAGTGATAQWFAGSCGSAVIGTGNSINVSPGTTTTYFVRYVGTCNTTACASVTVTVNSIVTAPASVTASVNPICSGGSTILTSNGGSVGAGIEDVWYQGACATDIYTNEWPTQPFATSNTTVNSLNNGVLTVTSTSNDPMIHMENVGSFAAATYPWIQFRYRVVSGTPGQVEIYYSKNGGADLSESQVVRENLIADGQWRIANVNMASSANWNGTITGWRLDYCQNSGVQMEIDYIILSTHPVINTTTTMSVSPASNITYFAAKRNECGRSACASVTVTVNTLSVAPTAIAGTTTICSGGNTTLTLSGGTAGTGAVAQWYSGSCGGTFIGNGNSINVSPTTNTTYFVRYSGTCNTTTCASVAVTVNTLSVAPTAITGTTTICNGGNTTLTLSGGTAGTGATAQWFAGSCGSAVIGTGNSINVSPGATTTYFVRYSGTCNTTTCTSVSVTVNSLSTPITTLSNPGTICPNTNTAITASGGVAGSGSTINWYTGPNGTGTLVGTGTIVTVAPTTNTTYYVRREGTCNNTADASVTINLKNYVYAATGTSSNTYCTDNAGWHHFYSGDEIIFSVQGDLSGAPAGFPVASITDNGTYYQETEGPATAAGCASNQNPGEERFEMERSWNVDLGGGTPIGTYNIRFYFQPAERTAIEVAAATWIATYPDCAYTYKYATPLGFYWFKNSGSNYVAPMFEDVQYTSSPGTTSNGVNYSQWTGITGFSGGSGGIILVPIDVLPVELTSLTALCNNTNDEVSVRWSTATEHNSSHYNVERSVDGSAWNLLTTTNAAGNSTITQVYEVKDYDVRAYETIYYRLQQFDQDGTSKQYGPVSVSCTDANSSWEVFPNPAGNEVTILLKGDYATTETQIRITDINGKVMQVINNDQQGQLIAVDLRSYAPGVYIVRLVDGENSDKFVRLVKQ